MPSSDVSENEAFQAKAKKPTTPRRSPAIRRARNATPTAKVSANKDGTPKSAPAGAKAGTKKTETTLLGDFLLGRPSVNRPRRSSFDAVRTEVKKTAVCNLQPPKGVNARVKQWQKVNAAAVLEDVAEPASEPEEVFIKIDGDSVTEEDRRRIKFRKDQKQSSARRKSGEAKAPQTPRTDKSSPKKRIVSDDHWMKNKERKSSPRSPKATHGISGGSKLPKDFLILNSTNPPLEKKIGDWAKRIANEKDSPPPTRTKKLPKKDDRNEETLNSKLRTVNVDSISPPEEEIEGVAERITNVEERAQPKRTKQVPKVDPANEDFPFSKVEHNTDDDGIRVTTLTIELSDDEGKPKCIGHTRRRKAVGYEAEGYHTPRRKIGNTRKPSLKAVEICGASASSRSTMEEEEKDIGQPQVSSTPSRPSRSNPCEQESISPKILEEIPVGYSAFSVLDMPTGSHARTKRPTRPQRQGSLSAVPKVLKRVYTEGLKMVHETVDHPRTGVNQPPSIESWLKGTSDPFIDDAPICEPVVEVADPKHGWETYVTKESHLEKDLLSIRAGDKTSKEWQNSTLPDPQSHNQDNTVAGESIGGSVSWSKSTERMVRGTAPPQTSASTLRRSPVTRHSSSPVSPKKIFQRNILGVTDEEKLERNMQEKPKRLENDVLDSITHERARTTSEGYAVRQTSRGSMSAADGAKQAVGLTRSPALRNISKFDRINRSTPDYGGELSRRVSPTTGSHRLSTIASVETFESSSSKTETCSELSQTTVTQTTLTQKTSSTSNTSHTSYSADLKSRISRQPSSHSGLKMRLTKHSDLLSVLSLHDASGPGRSKSILSARSVRTNRSRLDTATIPDLLHELAGDEAKYMRELKTLVDGVIPVLLSCVLSKSESAVAAGLFNTDSQGMSGVSITKPIVDMGISLERLKISHKHIPLLDPSMFAQWALGAYKVYEDYIAAWRMGFQDVIVNLAPASSSGDTEDSSSLDEMPRNTDGDVLNENGERVDVAFLLKRPLVRVKYLAKVMMGFSKLIPGEHTIKANERFQDLLARTRRRVKEEEARLVDEAANSTDTTRARDPRTLAPIEGVKIDSTRQVNAKDFFDFGLSHSNGQRIDCRVEMLLRDKVDDDSDAGDILICEVDTLSRWLLFPPIELNRISARCGGSSGELIVMIRGIHGSQEWHEIFTLKSADSGSVVEWIQMLGSNPMPPNVERAELPATLALPSVDPTVSAERSNTDINAANASRSPSGDIDVPIGERRRVNEEFPESRYQTKKQRQSVASSSSKLVTPFRATQEEPPKLEPKLRDLNDAMERAGKLSGFGTARTGAMRLHSRHHCESSTIPSSEILDKHSVVGLEHQTRDASFSGKMQDPQGNDDRDIGLAVQPANRLSPPRNRKSSHFDARGDKNSSAVKDSMRPHDLLKRDSSDLTIPKQNMVGDDEPPVPPPHSASKPELTKRVPLLATITSTFRNRRSSSPLKHEYQPSHASFTSSMSTGSESEDGEYSSDSSEEELEAVDSHMLFPEVGEYGKKVTPPGSIYNLPSGSLAPSSSASQAPYRGIPQPSNTKKVELIAAISCWSEKGRWDDLYPKDCCIVVGPGLIEAFPMNVFYPPGDNANEPIMESGLSDLDSSPDADEKRPLVALELTPIVPLRQSNALDIEIRSPPTARSTIKCTNTVRFRSRNLQGCSALYSAIHKARLENPVYLKLDQERILNSYGKQSYHDSADSNRRRSWLGRNKSYRASARAPSVTVSDNSTNSFASAISRLKNMGGIGGFNIAKSSVDTSRGVPSGTKSGPTSLYTDSSYSEASRATPPGTPSSPSIAMTGASNIASLGSTDLKIRLYHLETSSKWNELGNAFLSVTQPARGMRQASSLYHGIEKRIIVTKRPGQKRSFNLKTQSSGSPRDDLSDPAHIFLDVVLGGQCFSRLGVVGIAMNVWEDVVGDNGQVGTVGAIGGVSGRTRKWLFQCASAAEATWIFALVGGGGR